MSSTPSSNWYQGHVPSYSVAEQHADLHRTVRRAVEQELGLASGDFRHGAISGRGSGALTVDDVDAIAGDVFGWRRP
jgi:hypothetical protein